MAFIDTIDEANADEHVAAMYERQRAHYGYVPNYAKAFSHRPEMMTLWADLQAGIKRRMNDKRRFELVTFAAANVLRSTLCSIAHGKVLTEFVPADDVRAIARGETPDSLTPAEAAMIAFARKVAGDATSVTFDDIRRLKQHGFDDGEIFDIAATAGARAFWTKVLDALGVESDAAMRSTEPGFRDALTVGRPIDFDARAAASSQAAA